MSDIRRCPHCSAHLEQTSAVLNLSHGKTHFRSWLCRGCGTRVETRQLGNELEDVLLVSKPKAVIDAAVHERMEAESLGHREFQSIGGKRHVTARS